MTNQLRRDNISYVNGRIHLNGILIPMTNLKEAIENRETIISNLKTVKMLRADLPKIRKLQKSINKEALEDKLILRAIKARLELYHKRDYGNPGAEDRFVSRVQTLLQSDGINMSREVF